jgi:hypothetical protein
MIRIVVLDHPEDLPSGPVVVPVRLHQTIEVFLSSPAGKPILLSLLKISLCGFQGGPKRIDLGLYVSPAVLQVAESGAAVHHLTPGHVDDDAEDALRVKIFPLF